MLRGRSTGTRKTYKYWTDTVVHLLSPSSPLLPLLQTLFLGRLAVGLTVLERLTTSRPNERVIGVVLPQPVGTVPGGVCLFSYIGLVRVSLPIGFQVIV